MTAVMTLTSDTNGTFDFIAESFDLPLVGRTLNITRASSQGPSYSGTSVALEGFVDGNNHEEVIAKYQSLIAILKSNTVTFYYHDGTQEIFNRRMYVESYSEPTDWKQYDGTYRIGLRFIEPIANSPLDYDGLICSFVSLNGTFTFDPVPAWSRQTTVLRSSPYQSIFNRESEVTLRGFVYGEDHNAVLSTLRDMETVCTEDGILTYGTFTGTAYANGFSVQEDVPNNIAEYTLSFKVPLDNSIIQLSSSVSFDRLHSNPIVKKMPYCGGDVIVNFPLYVPSQRIRYTISAQSALSAAHAQSLVSAEAAILVVPGGYEEPGGSEEKNDRTGTYSMNFTKIYQTPVYFNTANT